MTEKTINSGPPMAIDHMLLYQMMSDPQFFTRVPLFHYLRDQALAITGQIAKLVVGEVMRSKTGCAGCLNVRDMMAPLMLPFVIQVRQIVEQDKTPELLQPLVDYIAERRNYRPAPIFVYYRDTSGKIAAVRF